MNLLTDKRFLLGVAAGVAVMYFFHPKVKVKGGRGRKGGRHADATDQG